MQTNIWIYLALMFSCVAGLCFGILLVASVTEEPLPNQMQPNYYDLWQQEIQYKNYYKHHYYVCIVESADKNTKVELIE